MMQIDPCQESFCQVRVSGLLESEKIDIQSWDLNGQFSVRNQTRNGREMGIRPTKERAD